MQMHLPIKRGCPTARSPSLLLPVCTLLSSGGLARRKQTRHYVDQRRLNAADASRVKSAERESFSLSLSSTHSTAFQLVSYMFDEPKEGAGISSQRALRKQSAAISHGHCVRRQWRRQWNSHRSFQSANAAVSKQRTGSILARTRDDSRASWVKTRRK